MIALSQCRFVWLSSSFFVYTNTPFFKENFIFILSINVDVSVLPSLSLSLSLSFSLSLSLSLSLSVPLSLSLCLFVSQYVLIRLYLQTYWVHKMLQTSFCKIMTRFTAMLMYNILYSCKTS